MNGINKEIEIAFQATQLILVFLTVFFSLKYPQIKKILAKKDPGDKKLIARNALVNELIEKFIINIPLLLISIVLIWLFLPLFIKVLLNSRIEIWNFDFARSSFVLISMLIFLFAFWSIKLILELLFQAHKISKKNWKWVLLKLIKRNRN